MLVAGLLKRRQTVNGQQSLIAAMALGGSDRSWLGAAMAGIEPDSEDGGRLGLGGNW